MANPVERAAVAFASSRPGSFFYVHVAPHIDRVLMPMTGGKLTTGGFGRVGMLTVTGAKTGKRRHTPLVFTRDGDNVVLVASRGGAPSHPAWYRNIAANPDVRFSINGDDRAYTAHEADAEERERIWPRCVQRYPGYETYRQRAGERVIPVMILEPRA